MQVALLFSSKDNDLAKSDDKVIGITSNTTFAIIKHPFRSQRPSTAQRLQVHIGQLMYCNLSVSTVPTTHEQAKRPDLNPNPCYYVVVRNNMLYGENPINQCLPQP